MVQECVDLDRILAAEERAGIQHVVLSPWVPLLFYDIDAEEALYRCRVQNQGLARIHAEQPHRVSMFGAIPLQDPALAAAETEELMSTGSFAGVEITASVGGTYLGDARFEPFWTAAERAGALVFVHPTTDGFTEPAFNDYYLHNLVGNPMETTLTAAHMVLAGVMERHPDLKVLLARGGGAIVALRGRLRHGHETIAAAGGTLERTGRLLDPAVPLRHGHARSAPAAGARRGGRLRSGAARLRLPLRHGRAIRWRRCAGPGS
jgi:aminocarboxymuconate-semialdehyde decarboxylase